MRINDLDEATAQPDLLHQTYYHGTATVEAARAIMKKGLAPPDLSKTKETNLRPVEGKVYLTPDIAYALIYAFGGNMVGNTHYRIPYKGNEDRFKYLFNDRPGDRHSGRYGYVFVVNPSALVDIQPDEDEVGELFMHCLKGKPDEYYDARTHDMWAKFEADSRRKYNFMLLMKRTATPAQIKRVGNAEYEYFAKVGKRALAVMDDDMKHWLCEIGMHVAHTGNIAPSECWKIDKTKIGYFDKDGSNFREMAKRVK